MPTNSLGPPGQRPMNPAAARQFGAFGAGARPQLAPRPAQPLAPQQLQPRPMAGQPPPARPLIQQQSPRPMAPRAPVDPRNPGQQNRGQALSFLGSAMMSDERSKRRIKELEDLNDTYASLLDTPAATADVKPKAPPTADLDRSNARALGEAGSYSYEYKRPDAPGAASGRQAGPMAQELRGIPGVVKPGPDGFDRVDTGRLALATASATGDQERRLRELENDYAALSDDEQLSRELEGVERDAIARIRGGR